PFLFCTVPPPTAISSLSLPDALPLSAPEAGSRFHGSARPVERDRTVRDIQSAAASTTRTPRIPMTEAAPRVRTRLSTPARVLIRSEEHTSELQSRENLVCRLLLEKKK